MVKGLLRGMTTSRVSDSLAFHIQDNLALPLQRRFIRVYIHRYDAVLESYRFLLSGTRADGLICKRLHSRLTGQIKDRVGLTELKRAIESTFRWGLQMAGQIYHLKPIAVARGRCWSYCSRSYFSSRIGSAIVSGMRELYAKLLQRSPCLCSQDSSPSPGRRMCN